VEDPLSAVDRLLRLGSIRLPWSHPVKPECPEAVCSITAIAPLDTQQACDALKVGVQQRGEGINHRCPHLVVTEKWSDVRVRIGHQRQDTLNVFL